MRAVLLLILIILLALASPLLMNHYLPDRLNPFAPLLIDRTPNFLTEYKIARLRASDQACFDVLAKSDLKFQRITDRSTGKGCGFFGAAMLEQSKISYGGDVHLTCPALVSLAIWERHDLQPLAEEILQQKVVRVRHYGTYSCRNVNGRTTGRRSQHATANAIDIAGFQLQDGSEITVLDDWGKDTPTGKFLTAIHAAACARFATVLGPNYNSLHKNHFHFDQGRYQLCR